MLTSGSTASSVLLLTTRQRPKSTTLRYALAPGVAAMAIAHGVRLLISDCHLMPARRAPALRAQQRVQADADHLDKVLSATGNDCPLGQVVEPGCAAMICNRTGRGSPDRSGAGPF